MAFPVRASAPAAIKKLTAWSMSRLKMYEQCPLKVKLSAIDKIAEPQSEPMRRGDLIHQLAEKFITGKHAKLAPELLTFKDLFKRLRRDFAKGTVVVEEMWCFKADWTETVWNDWKGIWLRVKVDVAVNDGKGNIMIIDVKTGRFSPQFNLQDYMDQLELYALGALVKFGDVKVKVRLVYTDASVVFPEDGHELDRTYTQADVPELKKKWVARSKPLLSDSKFAPKPNKFCYSCHYRKDNKENGGGQCKF